LKTATAALAAGVVGLALIGASIPVQQGFSPAWAQAPSAAKPIKVNVRRITETQYRHAIADVFGPDIPLNARFEPEKREDGLLAIGGAQLSLTSSGFEQYYSLANSIADQSLNDKRRAKTVPCQPADAKKADDACARQVITRIGEQLFRRPLTSTELNARMKTASDGAAKTGDFYGGMKLALVSLLMAPEYLFRIETAEADPAKADGVRLDGYTKASRLSFLLWDSGPDQELMDAARSGAIHSDATLKQQLARMVSAPQFRNGARAFFIDMLQLDGFDNLTKDPGAYPKFNQSVSDSAKEQTLRTMVDLLVDKKRDYREIFSSNETQINRYLASVYKVPYASKDEWTSYTFPTSSERAGILTQVSFLSLFSHPAASSPTRRGVKVHEIFMCEPTPEPPADVDFSKVRDSASGTVRGRLLDHMQNTGCTACHRRSDPPGLALEHFDGLGQLRLTENGAPIDVSADVDGRTITGAQGLARYLRENPKVPACLVRNVFAYGTGRKTDERDEDHLADRTAAFAASGYRLPELMVQIASSPEFLKATIPAGAAQAAPATANPEPQ
jgi:hypothetical protein